MKSKAVAMHLSAAMLAMAAMLGACRARITKVCGGEGLTNLTFTFGPEQGFALVFVGQRLVGASMSCVEGREPTTSAMLVVQDETSTDTVCLFDGLLSGGVLDVQVVTDDGASLDHADVDMRYDDLACGNKTLAVTFYELLDLSCRGSDNVADHIESLRAELVKEFGRRLAA